MNNQPLTQKFLSALAVASGERPRNRRGDADEVPGACRGELPEAVGMGGVFETTYHQMVIEASKIWEPWNMWIIISPREIYETCGLKRNENNGDLSD